VSKFVRSNGGFESIYFIPWLFCTIGISKHTSASSTSDIGLDIIKLKMSYNCIMDAFLKLNNFAFFVFKFNFLCGSQFMAFKNK
jgi:hypothetical protein